jgi:hypothetical protein
MATADTPETVDTPEYASIEDFVEYLLDEDRTSYTHVELVALARSLQLSPSKVRVALDDWGLHLCPRHREQTVRGFTTSSHDRWYGPGSSSSHGGSGWEQISGFAGQKG